MLATVLGLALVSAVDAAASCENVLGSKVFRCTVKRLDNTPMPNEQFEDCYRFRQPGVRSLHFDLNLDQLGDDALACGCTSKGKFGGPKFNQGAEFQCVTTGDAGFGLMLRGKPTGRKIKKGQGVNETGWLFTFECVEDPTCSGISAVRTGLSGAYTR